jgi:low temperature requirement protein LtrA
MATRQWWERPKLRVDIEEERRVSWLELFFDLVYVVVIAQLAHALSEHVSWSGVATYILLFLPMWWSWIGGIVYNDRFETYDLSYRLITFLLMLPVAAMAIFAHDGLGATSVPFALAYVANRMLIIFIWLRGGYHNPIFRPVSNRYAIGFSLSALLWFASIFVPPPTRFVLWGIGMVSDFVTPIFTRRFQATIPRSRHSKLPERFGLFMIIVLGEATVGVISGMADIENFTPIDGLTGVLGMALVFGLWWIYFDFVGRRGGPRPNITWSFVWNYLHVGLAMSIAAIGAAVLNVLAHEGTALEPGVRVLMASSLAVALLAIGLLEMVSRREVDEPSHPIYSPGLKMAAAIVALLIALFGGGVSSTILLLALILLVALQMMYGAFVWYSQPALAQAGD